MELLQAGFGQSASAYTDAETGATQVSVFLETKPPPTLVRSRLSTAFQHLKNCGLDTGPAKISVGPIRRENWAESWRRHFRPFEVSPRLLIKPSWSRRRPRKGQAVVTLDPGLSFGTGQHPTTGFCLQQLAARRVTGKAQSFLDLGTGSGILAIAAVRLGYGPVRALDFDAEAISTARRNARANRVSQRIRFLRCDIRKLPASSRTKYSVICANLISSLLIEQEERILRRLAPDGVLALAGILSAEFGGVRRAYEAAGLKLIASRVKGEWRSGAFRARAGTVIG